MKIGPCHYFFFFFEVIESPVEESFFPFYFCLMDLASFSLGYFISLSCCAA